MAKILVVDDSQFMRERMCKILEELGHEVKAEAANGDEAVALYKEIKPDLVTLDLTMPGVSGLDVLSQIMDVNEDANVIICSSLGFDETIADCIKEGAKGYIIKPYKPDTVKQVLEQAFPGGL